ncbi:hypothetical protein [Streptomyces europaeiscabiei]|uniref:hypothetical protein n=1 Tax=Streptomyces europaeiscabiei TaxID=146819 RepID=UPI0029BA4613|nr:hypothetical protein [Streptomyces europaeiscabiei]MDX2763955.1 hypothetical protein [Streptomyces europaeiscabiei]
MLHAEVTHTGESAYTWGGTDGSELIRTGSPYEVTFPDGTTVRGTWAECGNQFAEWAVTERPEWVCATAEGYADGYATMAQIQANIKAEQETDARALIEAVEEAESARADLERVWSVWADVIDELSSEDEDKVWDVAGEGGRGLAEAERAQSAGDRWGVADGARRGRAAVAWLMESARRCGLEIPEAAPVANAAPAAAATGAVGSGSSSDAASGAAPAVGKAPTAELGTCTALESDVTVKAPTQTPETAPEGTPESARRLISTSETGRTYVTGNGERLRIESVDGRMAYTLHTVHDEAHQEAKNGFAALAREFAGEVDKRGQGAPKWRKSSLGMWSGKPQSFKEFAPVDYAPGVMLAWTVNGVTYTGQVWANRIQSGKWNGDRGMMSAVVVATVDGRRARRDEAVCLPFVHGSRRKNAYAFVCTDGGNADVSVIAAECASDGLFDVVTPSVDVVDVWEGEGGAVAGVETPEPADTPDRTAAQETPAGAHCHRCGTDTVFGAECRTCGRVDIVAALMSTGPVLCPAEEKAMATGRQYCPRCFTVGVALYATKLHTGPGYVCAECYTANGRRLPEAGPSPVKAPAGAVVRAARTARKEAEESGASVGEIHRAGEAARKAVAVAYGQRPADVISDPCGADVWEGEGGACVGVDQPGTPDAGWGAAPAGTDPSPEIGTCTAPAVDVTPVRPDVASDPGAVATRDGEGGALPGVETVHVPSAQERGADDPYAVRPDAPEWASVPGTNRRTAELTCAGRQSRVYHAPDAVLPYTVRYTLGGADVDLGGWVGLEDARAIVRADRRRSDALEADRRRVEQEQRQVSVRLTGEERLAIARGTEEKHRPVTEELYVSPITGNAVLAWVRGTCNTTHDDHLWRPQTTGGSYRTPLSVERGTLAALVEKRGWTVTGTWMTHGTRGDTHARTDRPDPGLPRMGGRDLRAEPGHARGGGGGAHRPRPAGMVGRGQQGRALLRTHRPADPDRAGVERASPQCRRIRQGRHDRHGEHGPDRHAGPLC